jgi:signal peptidase I
LIAGGRLQQPSLIPSQEPEASKKKNPFWHDVWEIVETLILAVILYFAIDAVFARVRVENISMENTLMPGDLLVVNKLAYKFGPYHTGDIIIFHDPTGVKEDLIKRVIGTPGDTVSVHQGNVSVNGVVLQEKYIAATPDYEGDWVVPKDSLFVLGDNRNQSSDSHYWPFAFVPTSDVIGRGILVYWPLNVMKTLGDPYK